MIIYSNNIIIIIFILVSWCLGCHEWESQKFKNSETSRKFSNSSCEFTVEPLVSHKQFCIHVWWQVHIREYYFKHVLFKFSKFFLAFIQSVIYVITYTSNNLSVLPFLLDPRQTMEPVLTLAKQKTTWRFWHLS